MRKILPLLLALLFALPAFSATAYEVGGGKTLIVYDDGTYEVVESFADTSFLTGRQYSVDWSDSLSPVIALATASDPELSYLNNAVLSAMLASYIESSGISFSLIFLSEDEVLAVMTDEASIETERYDYKLTQGGTLYLYGEETESLVFSEDYSRLTMTLDGLPLVLSWAR